VIAENRQSRETLDDVDALVRRPAVADRVAQAIEDVDALALVCLEHRGQRLVVRVDIAEDPEAHLEPQRLIRHGEHR
jgi:hypothetical protein